MYYIISVIWHHKYEITYDKQADALYVKFQEGTFVENKEVDNGIIFDIGTDDALLGIEILNASNKVSMQSLQTIPHSMLQ